MARFVPAPAATRRRFVIGQNAEGYWVASDRAQLIERVFFTQRAALHFALFESGRCATAVSAPPGSAPGANERG